MTRYRVVSTKRGSAKAWGVECSRPGGLPSVIQEFWCLEEAIEAAQTLISIEYTQVERLQSLGRSPSGMPAVAGAVPVAKRAVRKANN